MWMSAPTPVTTKTIVMESGSTRSVASSENLPAWIQWNSRVTCSRSWSGRLRRSPSAITARMYPPATVAEANHPANLPSLRPKKTFTAAPARGRAGTSQMSLSTVPSAPQHRGVVDARALAAAEHVHDDRQAHDDLGRCHHHREERQDLAVQAVVHPAEGHEREVHRVQLELDGHEDDERVLAHEHADGAD